MTPYDYSAVRKGYLPPKGVKVLFIGESAPNPRSSEVRFFYHPVLRPADNLFRGLMLALYGADKDALALSRKTQWLDRFQSDGYYLDDLCPEPVNHLPVPERSRARRAAVKDLLERIDALSPGGIVICHQGTYADIAEPLRTNRLPVLHTEPIPFPLGNHRTRFVDAVRAALYDVTDVMPIANLENSKGDRTLHGIKGATGSPSRSTGSGFSSVGRRPSDVRARRQRQTAESAGSATATTYYTQRITAADIKGGRIRIPGQAKALFPPERTDVDVELRGQRKSWRWDPRYDGDKQRSGVLGIGNALMRMLSPKSEPLRIRVERDVFHLG